MRATDKTAKHRTIYPVSVHAFLLTYIISLYFLICIVLCKVLVKSSNSARKQSFSLSRCFSIYPL